MLDKKRAIGRRLKEALDKRSLQNTDLARNQGVTIQAVGGWVRTGEIASERIASICKFLHISSDWLLTGNAIAERAGVYAVDISTARHIPVVNAVQAGNPKEVVDAYTAGDGFDKIWLDPELAEKAGRHAFALRVTGDSMLPDYRPGDIVVIDPDVAAYPGDIVVAKLKNEEAATLKRYRQRPKDPKGRETFDLVPLNDNYPVITVNAKNPGRIIGPVIEHRRNPRAR